MPPVNSHAHVRIPGPYRFGERSTPAPIIRAYSPRLIYGGRFKGNPVMIGMGNKQNVQKPISTHPLQERQLLWAVRISDAPLDTSAASPILQKHLTAAEREKVCRFIRVPDQQRALLSVLLQRAAVKHCFPSLSTADYDLPRTREGKPFLRVLRDTAAADGGGGGGCVGVGTWNFNVSHHGDFVCIAAHPSRLVGADVVDIDVNVTNNRFAAPKEFIMMFSQQLTAGEINVILSQPSERAQYTLFFLHWALKEAFIKAVGQGLGFDLQRVEFSVGLRGDIDAMREDGRICASAVAVRIDGHARTDWRFELTNLDRRHVLAVAYGPLSEALPSFLAATGWADCTTQPAEAASATATASASATAEGPMPAVQMQRLDALLRLSAP